MLNGVFCWFKRLPELWQTVLVAASIFTAGMTFGIFAYTFRGVPSELRETVQRVDTLEAYIQEQDTVNEEVTITLQRIISSIDTVKNQVIETNWRVRILSCYQDAGDSIPVNRDCLEDARALGSVDPGD